MFPRQKETAPSLLQFYVVQDVAPNSDTNHTVTASSSTEMALSHGKKENVIESL